jgi:hypothetical protein
MMINHYFTKSRDGTFKVGVSEYPLGDPAAMTTQRASKKSG